MNLSDGRLTDLKLAYSAVRAKPPTSLSRMIERLADRAIVFVGSGGALAVAQFAADLHMAATGKVSMATTPLLLSQSPFPEAAVVVISAGAGHPDVLLATETAIRSGNDLVFLVTHRPREELKPRLQDQRLEVVTVSERGAKDGFLATTSVLAFCASFLTAYSVPEWVLPDSLPHLDETEFAPLRARSLILTGPGHAAVGSDLESRLFEMGLSSAQVTDYRNFAHGRHFGLAQNLESSTVIAVISPEILSTAEATLRYLPKDAGVVRLSTAFSWPASVLDLLAASMTLVDSAAQAASLNPVRPGVSDFGRRLYRMSVRRMLSPPRDDPIQRKLRELVGSQRNGLRRIYEEALDKWLDRLGFERFGAVVLDYDGTVCTTEGRFALPSRTTQEAVLRLLDAKLIVGFASGRGQSLLRDLRAWIPRDYWPMVEVALYTGAIRMQLSDTQPTDLSDDVDLDLFCERLRGDFKNLVGVERRPSQLTLTIPDGSGLTPSSIAVIAAEIAGRPPVLSVKVARSAHSVDVIPSSSSKATLFQDCLARSDGEVLAIGDQGQVGGNDFELLAAGQWTISVDRCSADPERCWNIAPSGVRGPDALVSLLRGVKPSRGRGARLSVRRE